MPPLFEFYCESCRFKFEQLTSSHDPDHGKCPKCQKKSTQKLISRFRVGGQGDLRESTFHGCHDGFDGLGGGSDGDSDPGHEHHHDHDHGHGHDHDHSHGDGDGHEGD